jgi:sarcosine/dimethylglycine N-methyltransferase
VIHQAGNTALTWRADTQSSDAWFAQLRVSEPPPRSRRGRRPDFAQFPENLGRNLMEDQLGALTMIFESHLN